MCPIRVAYVTLSSDQRGHLCGKFMKINFTLCTILAWHVVIVNSFSTLWPFTTWMLSSHDDAVTCLNSLRFRHIKFNMDPMAPLFLPDNTMRTKASRKFVHPISRVANGSIQDGDRSAASLNPDDLR